MTNTTILQGIVGSHAYGLAREGSDFDRIGVFVAPTLEVAGLDWSSNKETYTNASPDGDDTTIHEIAKYLKLVLKCNPTVSELLWIDEYEIKNYIGRYLVDNRDAFLSAHAVFSSYLGYANAQLTKFQNLDFKPKHARHALRLLRQGRDLYTTGTMTLKVHDPEIFWEFDTMAPGAILEILAQEFSKFKDEETHSALPDEPNRDVARDILSDARSRYM